MVTLKINHSDNKAVIEPAKACAGAQPSINEGTGASVLVEWNTKEKSLSAGRPVHELFREQVERTPEQIALIGERQAVSYLELNRRANQLGHYLQSLGVGPEVVVGSCLKLSTEAVVALIGVLKAGGAYLPLDPGAPIESLSHALNDAGVKFVLTEQGFKERLPTYSGKVVCLDIEWERIHGQNECEPESEVVPESLACVIFPLVSTGVSKGVFIEHHNVVNFINWQSQAFSLSPRSQISPLFSYNFDGAVGETFMALLNGAALVISTPDNLEPHRLLGFFDEVSIDHGFISVESAREENNRFKVSKDFTSTNQYSQKNNSTEYITPARILESVKGLDADLIKSTVRFIEKYGGDEFAYRGFSRYFREGADNSYSSCGINRDILKMLFPYQTFAGLKGIDFCFGNGEVLETLSEMGALMLGLDLSPFLVQNARSKNLNVRMAKVDIPPQMFAKESDVEEGSQSFVISTLTLDRLYNPKNFLENLFMCLKEGGRFAIQTILPIVPIDDGNVENPIIYTSLENRITPGQSAEQDKEVLLRLLYTLGACDLNVCQLPYVVASRDGVQEYEIWSFYGSKSSKHGLERRHIYRRKLSKDSGIHFRAERITK